MVICQNPKHKQRQANSAPGGQVRRVPAQTPTLTWDDFWRKTTMARIAGVDLPREKRVQVGLTYVYGIGQTTANKILAATGINPDTRVKDLTLEEEAKIRDTSIRLTSSSRATCVVMSLWTSSAWLRSSPSVAPAS